VGSPGIATSALGAISSVKPNPIAPLEAMAVPVRQNLDPGDVSTAMPGSCGARTVDGTQAPRLVSP
jgi:hypothetical protein